MELVRSTQNGICQSRLHQIIADALYERVICNKSLPRNCVVCCDATKDALIRKQLYQLVTKKMSGWKNNCKELFFRIGLSEMSLLDDILMKLYRRPEDFIVISSDGSADVDRTFNRLSSAIDHLITDVYRRCTCPIEICDNGQDTEVTRVQRHTELNPNHDYVDFVQGTGCSEYDIDAFRKFICHILASKPELSEIFEMRVDGYDSAEVSKVTGRSTGYVNKQYFMARQRVQRYIETHPDVMKLYI